MNQDQLYAMRKDAGPTPPSEYEQAAMAWSRAKDAVILTAAQARKATNDAALAAAKEEEAWNRVCSLRLPQPED